LHECCFWVSSVACSYKLRRYFTEHGPRYWGVIGLQLQHSPRACNYYWKDVLVHKTRLDAHARKRKVSEQLTQPASAKKHKSAPAASSIKKTGGVVVKQVTRKMRLGDDLPKHRC
jgi:hypothetical protein